jgi:Fe2+ transport system protein FeoA
MTLTELGSGESAIIEGVRGEGAVRGRLLDMGLTPGTLVYMRKTAPMGDPIQLSLRGYELTIRKADAGRIDVRAALDRSVNPYKFCTGNCAACMNGPSGELSAENICKGGENGKNGGQR